MKARAKEVRAKRMSLADGQDLSLSGVHLASKPDLLTRDLPFEIGDLRAFLSPRHK